MLRVDGKGAESGIDEDFRESALHAVSGVAFGAVSSDVGAWTALT